MTREQFEALAAAARPHNNDDWGSDRQIDAENKLFDEVCRELSNAGIVKLEDYSLKATTEERIAKARQLMFGETNMTEPMSQAESQYSKGEREIIEHLGKSRGRPLTQEEINLSLEQARAVLGDDLD